ncbi:hypothetical protein APS47_13795 [Leptospira kirschneri serovar Mozdok]|nr:hypothetical protein APS47_13795 [Leptospira kirschneri serovar Mozdok]
MGESGVAGPGSLASNLKNVGAITNHKNLILKLRSELQPNLKNVGTITNHKNLILKLRSELQPNNHSDCVKT